MESTQNSTTRIFYILLYIYNAFFCQSKFFINIYLAIGLILKDLIVLDLNFSSRENVYSDFWMILYLHEI